MKTSDQSKLLADLLLAKALFQQGTIYAILTEGVPQSKTDQKQMERTDKHSLTVAAFPIPPEEHEG